MIRKYYKDDATADSGGGGGEPKAPAGYAVTTPQQRTDWNSFLDYANKQPGANLNDPKGQATLMAQYKKTNPNFSITPAQLPSIQYEAYQLRKGAQFGNLGAQQLGYIRQGLSPNYINADTSNVGKLYYPQVPTYGTDLENYYNSKFNPSAATPVAAPTAPGGSPTTVAAIGQPTPATSAPGSAGAAPAVTAKPGQTSAASGSTLPTVYASHDSALKRTNELAAMPGNEFLHGRGDALINANYVPDGDTKSFRDSAEQAAKKVGLDPALFWGSAAEEGATGLIPDKNGGVNTDPKIDLNGKYPVSGFSNFGLDNFDGNFKELVRRGYLPKNFDYEKSPHVNERGVPVVSGNFKTVEDALTAKAAYVRMEQDNLDDWTKSEGRNIQLSPNARKFFTVVAYNGGPGTAHNMINYYKSHGLLNGDKFLQQAPPEDVDPGNSYGKVLPRWKIGELLKSEKILQ